MLFSALLMSSHPFTSKNLVKSITQIQFEGIDGKIYCINKKEDIEKFTEHNLWSERVQSIVGSLNTENFLGNLSTFNINSIKHYCPIFNDSGRLSAPFWITVSIPQEE